MMQLAHAKVAEGLSATSLPRSIDSSAGMPDSPIFVTASHQTGLDTRSIIVGFWGEDARVPAEAWDLLDYAGHQPTLCNVGLMSLA